MCDEFYKGRQFFIDSTRTKALLTTMERIGGSKVQGWHGERAQGSDMWFVNRLPHP